MKKQSQKLPQYRLTLYDWKDQPDWNEVNKFVRELLSLQENIQEKIIVFTEAPPESDTVFLIISIRKFTKAECREVVNNSYDD
jgi:hypothetical protein